MILLAEIHNGFHNKNHKDIVAVDIVVRNTAVAAALRIEATKGHTVVAVELQGHKAVAIVAVVLHIEDTADIQDIGDTVYTVAAAVVLQEHTAVVEGHIEDTVDIQDTAYTVVAVYTVYTVYTAYIEEGN